jgi:hypothetical protein
MKSRALVVAALACLLSVNALAQAPAAQAPLRVFDATELTPDRYTVIKRIWVESWRSAFWVPAHADSAGAIAALSAEAARVGADAVTDLVCLNDDRAFFDRGYFCYGLAVKLK